MRTLTASRIVDVKRTPYHTIDRLRESQSGLALIEFALILPFLILLTFGGAELANLAITNARISAITSSIADGVARVRDRIDENDINDVITGAKFSAGSLDLTSRGRIIISTVEDNAATATPTDDQIITWQRCKGTKNVPAAQTIGTASQILTSGIGAAGAQVSATPGNPVVIVQIFYDYKPIMSDIFFGARTIQYSSAFSVRDRTLQTLQNGLNLTGSALSTCGYYSA
ncbi:MAG: TadE/TadG family type IV pilus assembly protein [Sphingobium sp.]|uniref:TadE/TadG family type IV pilus assembly protein n=1 Tax=Sphingobium sp. TaxID=1912891 RepID=UPI0029A48806|nr:TadE/TadG family type IV pilus assembly protein [Sphingobium sp.]MDX3909995.1 TadE/TadG family type IV pilus assembly protein [Sphingobium sp.]